MTGPKWSYMVDNCGDGGYFSTNGGIITSPSYPDNYPNNANCLYTISQPIGTVILLKFHIWDIDRISCLYEYYGTCTQG